MESHISREKKRIPLIGSDEAAKLLGISLRTLYSYVSRGRIGRVIDPVTGNSQYNRAEVEEYARKRDRGRSAGSAARAWNTRASAIAAAARAAPRGLRSVSDCQ